MKYLILILPLLALPLAALAQGNSTDFVALTNIPALNEVGNAINTPEGLSLFLNNIYRLAIGAAAVVAVLQIMRAGIMYMGSDSGFAEKKEAKNLIGLAIGGLILVLSPVIVFSIINPEILSLKIGGEEGINGLKTELRETAPPPADGGTSGAGNGTVAPPSVIPNTGEVNTACRQFRDGDSLPANDSTAEACCSYQQSPTLSCAAAWSYTTTPPQHFCRCEFKGIITQQITYQTYYLYNSAQNKSVAQGLVPRDKTRVDTYVASCTSAGGQVKYESAATFFERRLKECPADTGVNSAKTYSNGGTSGNFTQYQCEDRKAKCEYRR